MSCIYTKIFTTFLKKLTLSHLLLRQIKVRFNKVCISAWVNVSCFNYWDYRELTLFANQKLHSEHLESVQLENTHGHNLMCKAWGTVFNQINVKACVDKNRSRSPRRHSRHCRFVVMIALVITTKAQTKTLYCLLS